MTEAFGLPAELRANLLRYLQKRPIEEAYGMWNALQHLRPIAIAKTPTSNPAIPTKVTPRDISGPEGHEDDSRYSLNG